MGTLDYFTLKAVCDRLSKQYTELYNESVKLHESGKLDDARKAIHNAGGINKAEAIVIDMMKQTF